MTLSMTQPGRHSACAVTNEEFERIAAGLHEALEELSAPEPLQRELELQLEALRSQVVLVRPAARARHI